MKGNVDYSKSNKRSLHEQQKCPSTPSEHLSAFASRLEDSCTGLLLKAAPKKPSQSFQSKSDRQWMSTLQIRATKPALSCSSKGLSVRESYSVWTLSTSLAHPSPSFAPQFCCVWKPTQFVTWTTISCVARHCIMPRASSHSKPKLFLLRSVSTRPKQCMIKNQEHLTDTLQLW